MRTPRVAAITAIGGMVAAAALREDSRAHERRCAAPEACRRVIAEDGTGLHAIVRRPNRQPQGAIVFAHGWVMGAAFWTEQAHRLTEQGWLTVAYDQRGHQASDRPPKGGCTLSHLGNDLNRIVAETVPRDLPAVVVGHSMGAMAILAAAQAGLPSHVRGAVLANTAVHELIGDALRSIGGVKDPRVQTLIRHALYLRAPIPASAPGLRFAVRYVAHGPDPTEDAVSLTTRLLTSCRPAVRTAFARSLTDLDLREAVTSLTIPSMVVTSRHDRLTPPAHGADLAAALPDAVLRTMPTCGHQAPLEDPAAFAALVAEHAATVRADPRAA